MNIITKQVVGVHVQEKELSATIGKLLSHTKVSITGQHTFRNTHKGRIALTSWANKNVIASITPWFLLEAYGTYHDPVTYFLADNGHCVSLLSQASADQTFAGTFTLNSCRSELLTLYGLRNELKRWLRPERNDKILEQLNRERDTIIIEQFTTIRQYQKEIEVPFRNRQRLKRIQQRLDLFDSQLACINLEIKLLINMVVTTKKNDVLSGP